MAGYSGTSLAKKLGKKKVRSFMRGMRRRITETFCNDCQ
jgi:hypothetical protein